MARGEVNDAKQVLKYLDDCLASEPDREVLALTDLFLLNAWVSVKSGNRENAIATLECTHHLLNAMYDPLLKWFRQAILAKAAPTLQPGRRPTMRRTLSKKRRSILSEHRRS